MKQVERILWVVAGLGLLLKVAHLPFGGFLLILAMGLLSMMYFFLAWRVFPTPTPSDQSKPLSLGVGLVLSVAVIGILFKLQLWPLSSFVLGGSLVGLVLITGGVLAFRPHRPNLFPYTRALFVRLVWVTIVCIVLFLLPADRINAFYTGLTPLP